MTAKPREEGVRDIKKLEYQELCTCDYGDTDKVIDYILALARKINEIVEELPPSGRKDN